MDKMTLGGYWGRRPEEVKSSVIKITSYFESLSELHKDYENWYGTGRSLKASLNNKVVLDEVLLTKRILKAQNFNDEKIPDPELGYYFHLWNGNVEDGRSLSISWSMTSIYSTNSVLLDMPYSGDEYTPADDELSLKLIKSSVDVWSPDFLYIYDVNELIQRNLRIRNPYAGLFTYTCRNDFREKIIPFAEEVINYKNGLIIKGHEDPEKQGHLIEALGSLFHKHIPWIETK